MKLFLLALLPLALTGSSRSGSTSELVAQQPTGAVIPPDEGEKLIFCGAPGLSATIKVDSASTGATRLAMGTAEIAARSSNVGVHRDEDEVVFFYRGSGSAILGSDTVPTEPGTTMFVPRGLRHGFINPGDSSLVFVWVVVPGSLAQRFRSVGRPVGRSCPS